MRSVTGRGCNQAAESMDAAADKYRENEAKFVEKLKDDIAKGTAWERIAELIGLENSQSKTIRPTSAGSDLARMREILLSLKRDGDKAPGAAGY